MNFNRLLHTPVTNADTGKRVGKLSDFLIKQESGNVAGIVVTNDSLFYSKRYYDWDKVRSIGIYGITVSGIGERYRGTVPPNGVISFMEDAYGKPVSDGNKTLGITRDMEIDLEKAKMTLLEVSRGLSEDILHGRDRVFIQDGFFAHRAVVRLQNPVVRKKRGSKKE